MQATQLLEQYQLRIAHRTKSQEQKGAHAEREIDRTTKILTEIIVRGDLLLVETQYLEKMSKIALSLPVLIERITLLSTILLPTESVLTRRGLLSLA